MEAFIFCSKNLQNWLYRGTLQNPIFMGDFHGLHVLIFFSQVGLKSGVWKTASFITFCILGFFYSSQSYMLNVLKINCGLLPIGRRPQFRLLAKYIQKIVRTDMHMDRARYDWLLLMIKY